MRTLIDLPLLGQRARWLALALLLGALAGMPVQAQKTDAKTGAPRDAMAGHGAHRARAQLATGAAFAPDGSLWIVGLNEQERLFVQQSPTQALGRWSPPRVLDTGSDAISADGENRPKIAFGPQGWVVISYTEPLAKPYTGWIRMLRSADGGRSFSAPFTVHRDQQEITHRFESIAFDASGALHTFWIDKRDQPARGSSLSYVGAAVYHNVSTDGGASFGPDLKLADHSCECCRIALAPGPDGQLRALWRHVFGEQTRDHAFASLADSPAPTVTRASYDEWQINACPHHGPGLAPAADADNPGFHAVWFGMRQVQGRSEGAVRYARLGPNGAPVPGTERALPDPRAEHADVMAQDRRVAIVWRSTDGERTQLKAWLSSDGGKTFTNRQLAETRGNNDHPRLVQSGARMVVVWRLPQEVQVHDIAF